MKSIERHRYDGDKIIHTRRIVFEPYRYCELNMCLVMGLIQRNLTPDLLRNKKLAYPGDIQTNKWYGHCYHATQALYYIMDTDQLVPMSAEDYRGEKHWWLQNGKRLYDATSDQYYVAGKVPPHHNGKKDRWYGWKQRPHQATLNLMVKVLGDRIVTKN